MNWIIFVCIFWLALPLSGKAAPDSAPDVLPEVQLPPEARQGPASPVFRPPTAEVPPKPPPAPPSASAGTQARGEASAPSAAPAPPTVAVTPSVETKAELPQRKVPAGMKLKPVTKSPEVRQRQLEQLAARFLQEMQQIAAQHVGYSKRWVPPGAKEALEMDCSNTARYLYQRVANIDIGRTASDQFFLLREKRKAWAVPLDRNGRPDKAYIQAALVPGDLLFWENTYRPERNPPITHVMIYVGNYGGRPTMVGSRSSQRGGPNIYAFDPWEQSGGYSYKGKRIQGRFLGYGRPLNF